MNAFISSHLYGTQKYRGKSVRGFTILEVVFAASIVSFTLGAIYLTHWKTLDTIRQAHRSVNASQVLQEKAEILRGVSWGNLTHSAFGSGSACLGGAPATSELQIQSVNSLVETIMISEDPPPTPPTPAGGYTITRTISYPLSGTAVSSTVALVSSSPFSSGASRAQGFLRVTWALTASGNAVPYSRNFQMTISNPPQ